MITRVRAERAAGGRGGPVRRAAVRRARLDLPARPGGPDRRRAGGRARCTSTTGCAERRTPTSVTAPRCARRLGVALEVRRPRRPESGNVQAWARDERYGAAPSSRSRGGGDVAAGHTATDQVETILYRLASSPSRRALLGMRAREGCWSGRCSAFTREETAAYCRSAGLRWREDESNASDAYARNRIRAALVPALHGGPSGRRGQRARAGARSCATRRTVLDALVDEVLGGGARIELDAAARAAAGAAAARRAAPRRRGGRRASRPGRRAGPSEIAALSDHGTARCSTSATACGRSRSTASCGSSGSAPARARAPSRSRCRSRGAVRFGALRGALRARRARRASPGVLDREALGPSCSCARGAPATGWRRSACGGTKTLQDLFTARRVPRRERQARAGRRVRRRDRLGRRRGDVGALQGDAGHARRRSG